MIAHSLKRRDFIVSTGAAVLGGAAPVSARLAVIEARTGGRLGLAAIETGTGKSLRYRADERFAMASTFKWLLAAFVLSLSDKGDLQMDQQISYGSDDLLPHSPITTAHMREGSLSVAALAAAAVETSDNGAANLLLKHCGGPAALTRFLRAHGDGMTRLDRIEMALNSNIPDDPRDTTTPGAMIATMRTVLVGEAISAPGRALLTGWLKKTSTGMNRLRAGLPYGWVVGDKTGTGENGAINDVAIAWRPGSRARILIACYLSGGNVPLDMLEAAHAQVAGLVAADFG